MTRVRAFIERFVPPGALVLATLTFGSYAMGLVRDRAFAHTFGAGAALDAYNAAFVLPELLLDVLVASGLTAPFVPIFIRLAAQSRPEAERFARTVATAATGLMLVVSLLLFVAAPATTAFIAPGFTGDQATRYVELFRLMCLTPALFALSIALGELLVAERRFIWYALAPILYNAGIVGGTVLLGGSLGIRGAAIGTVVGAALHLGIRVAGILRTDLSLRPAFAIRTADFREFVRLMLPKMAAHPIEPITFLFFTQLATTLGAGTVSSLSFARNFQSVPVNLIGAAFSIAVFPTLSAAAAAATARHFVGRWAEISSRSAASRSRRHSPSRSSATSPSGYCSGAEPSTTRPRPGPRPWWWRSRSRCPSTPCPSPWPAASTRPGTRSGRSSRRSSRSASSSSRRTCSSRPSEWSRSRPVSPSARLQRSRSWPWRFPGASPGSKPRPRAPTRIRRAVPG